MNNEGMQASREGMQDEVSLVDLTVILVQRWKALIAVFLTVFIASLLVAWWLPTKYEYSSVYQMAGDTAKPQLADDDADVDKNLESADALINLTKLNYKPDAMRAVLKDEQKTSLPFGVSISHPEDTSLVVLTSKTEPGHQGEVKRLHQTILQSLTAHQNAEYDRKAAFFNNKLDALENNLARLNQSDQDVGDVISAYQNERGSLQARLEGLSKGEVSRLAAQGGSPSSISPVLIVAVGAMVGIILSIMAVFIMHFISAVRQRLREIG
ncbi:hypothetical protein [Chromohalobacter sp. 296-RDG]|uniref:hypothetical protein n=1 Tax=Chromohalobacter sp. 296-RDG TaxID=2994062 RepID=UPI0024690CA3|nr:hypothetical protein [Chromohalobacter sp. 296-RDG]